jgi:3-phenylpropionate/cinnamic acid dioxygenase small subunit
VSADNTDLASILARLQVLEDERAVLSTLQRYGHYIDYGRAEEWVQLFTADATYLITSGRPDVDSTTTVSGHDELRDFIGRHSHAPELFHKHVLAEPMISVNGDEASAESYWLLALERKGNRAGIVGFGRYLDTLRRQPNGVWLFTQRRIEVDVPTEGSLVSEP